MSSQSNLKLTLGQITMTVSNIGAAVVFYRDKLGLPFLFSAPPGLAFFNLDGIRLMLSEPEGSQDAGRIGLNSILYFKVENIKDYFDTLCGRGVSPVEKPHVITKMGQTELWMAFFKDPDGNLLGIMSEVPV